MIWANLGIPPSALCNDATFIRRVTSDIAGRLPTADEARAFIADKDGNKRAKLIDKLLDGPGYADYFANKWANVLRNRRVNANDIPYTFRFHNWIRQALRKNMPYDQFVRNVLAASGDPDSHPPAAWFKVVSSSTTQMEDTAQLFLGMRICLVLAYPCAQPVPTGSNRLQAAPTRSHPFPPPASRPVAAGLPLWISLASVM